MENNFVKTVDIHNMGKSEAKFLLERLLINLDPKVKELVVIHGYNSGSTLQTMVRKELKSKRIKQRILSLNQGTTSLILD